MDNKTKPTMYEIPSCEKVYHVQEKDEIRLIKYLYGDWVIEYKPKSLSFLTPDGLPGISGDTIDSTLRDFLQNRIGIIYIVMGQFWTDGAMIYFTDDSDYAQALLTIRQ